MKSTLTKAEAFELQCSLSDTEESRDLLLEALKAVVEWNREEGHIPIVLGAQILSAINKAEGK